MTKIHLFINISFLLIAILFSAIPRCSTAISNKRLCYDPECSEPVSLARTNIKYAPNEQGILAFDANVEVKVYSKSAGTRDDLWGVEINGQRGYAPKSFLRENKILRKNLKFEVPTEQLSSSSNTRTSKKPLSKEENNNSKVVSNDDKASDPQDDKAPNSQDGNSDPKPVENGILHNLNGVAPSYEVIDGTTVHFEPDEPFVQPTFVTKGVQATAVPNKQHVRDTESNGGTIPKTPIIAAQDEEKEKKKKNNNLIGKRQGIIPEININNFLASSEEVPDLGDITGVTDNTPVVGVNTILQNSTGEKVKENTELPSTSDTTNVIADQQEQVENDKVTGNKQESQPLKNADITSPNVIVSDNIILTDGSVNENVNSSSNTGNLNSKDDSENVSSKQENENVISKEEKENVSPKEEKENVNPKEEDENVIPKEEKENVGPKEEGENVIPKEEKENIIPKEEKENVSSKEEIENISLNKENDNVTPKQENENVSPKEENENVSPKEENENVSPKEENENIIPKEDNKSVSPKENIAGATTVMPELESTSEGTITNTDSNEEKSDSNLKTDTENNSDRSTPKGTENLLEDTANLNNELQSSTNHIESEVEGHVEQASESSLAESSLKGGDNIPLGLDDTQSEVEISIEKDTTLSDEISTTESSENKVPSDESEKKSPNESELDSTIENESVKVYNLGTGTLSPSSDKDTATYEKNDISDNSNNEDAKEQLQKDTVQEIAGESQDEAVRTTTASIDVTAYSTMGNNIVADITESNATVVNTDVNSSSSLTPGSASLEVPTESNEPDKYITGERDLHLSEQLLPSSQKNVISEHITQLNEFRNRNLLNVEKNAKLETENIIKDETGLKEKTFPEYGDNINSEDKVLYENLNSDNAENVERTTLESIFHEVQVSSPEVCSTDYECEKGGNTQNRDDYVYEEENNESEDNAVMSRLKVESNYWLTLSYLSITAITILMFSLGYYYVENMRRDGYLIAKINKLEKELLVSTKECTMLTENLKISKDRLTWIEDESFGSNEMVLSLKAELEASQNVKAELEDQVAMLEKDLESATEAGLELERMLREVLSSNSDVNPLAQSVEDLQTRLNAQQAANESLTNALNLKTQENEAMSADLHALKKKYEELEVEVTQLTASLRAEAESKNNMKQTLSDKLQQLEMQLTEISTDKGALQKELKNKEVEIKDLIEVINQLNSNNLDLDKLYDVSRIKAEAAALLEERNELKVRLSEVEGAHNLLEEHMNMVKEGMSALTEQCKLAEKEKKDAETRLEVLSNFFKEKEAQRQKEEAVWMQKQGEVVSTVERIQTMQNEIQNYKQQTEMLKREILDQESEYKSQISVLETKAHEQWVVARQLERRLEESKTEAGQLRNRLTLIEKNINDADPDAKLHRLEANGETTTSPPLFLGAESSSSPIMFTGSSGVPPPPPPSYMHPSLFPPYLPPPLPTSSGVPPYEVGQRPPPLGGRLSSPPPMPHHPPTSSRYDNASSPPPPMSPHLLPPFNHHRSPPPPFGGDHIHHPPPPPPPGTILPPPLGTAHSWGEDTLPPVRNSGFHPHQREQRVRNHKGSLHSSGESLDRTHHSSKV